MVIMAPTLTEAFEILGSGNVCICKIRTVWTEDSGDVFVAPLTSEEDCPVCGK
jgi:hypothetical protein